MFETIKSSRIAERLASLAKNDSQTTSLLILVETVFDECSEVMKTTVKSMPEYTLHDEVHLQRVVKLMGRLIPDETFDELKPLELASLILSAALHDVGMAPTAEEIQTILRPNKSNEKTENRRAYETFCEGYPQLLARQSQMRAEQRHSEAHDVDAYLLAEFLRQTHGERGRAVVFDRYETKLIYGEFNFASALADTCYTHSRSPESLNGLLCRQLVRSPGEYCNWRFVALMLRLADILDFDPKRTPAILFEHLGVRSPVSVREWKKHQSITAWDIQCDRIAFAAQCLDPVIEKCVRDFGKMIDHELLTARSVCLGFFDKNDPQMRSRYRLDLPTHVDMEQVAPVIGLEGPSYTYVDLSFYLDKDSIISLIMGISLYAQPVLFLRELIQNAVDAVRHRLSLQKNRPDLGPLEPRVIVRLLERGGVEYIEVEDNGMGMDEDIVRNYFARVGCSYYKSARFRQELAMGFSGFRPVSQFGIGILSVFMAGDKLSVETMRVGVNSRSLAIDIEGEGALFWFRRSARDTPGTKVCLRLKRPSKTLFVDTKKELRKAEVVPCLFDAVAELVPHVEFPIRVVDGLNVREMAGSWRLPDKYISHQAFIEKVDLDLPLDATPGLSGVASVYLVCVEGLFTERQFVEGEEDEVDVELRDSLEWKYGYIEHVNRDRSIKSNPHVSEGYSIAVSSAGRWSQQGFLVPYPLFEENLFLRGRSKRPNVGFPFPVFYDLNLFGDFSFPLSADRKGVLLCDESVAVCERICAVFATLLLRKLGRHRVFQNRAFLERVVESDDRGEVFGRVLNEFLAQKD